MANGPGPGPSRPEAEVEVGVGGVSGVDDGTGNNDNESQGDQTVDIDHSANAKPYPEPQSAEGAFVNDAGIDLNESADHTPTAQGNKYGVQKDAAENYVRDADARIRDLEKQLEEATIERDKWQEVVDNAESGE